MPSASRRRSPSRTTVTNTFKLDLDTVQTFSTKDTDFTTQATALLNAQPDLVIVSGLASDGGNLVKQLRELGYKGLIIGGNGFNTAKIFPVCKAQCDGILVAQAYSPGADIADQQGVPRRCTRRRRMPSRPVPRPRRSRQCRSSSRRWRRWISRLRSPAMDLAALRSALNAQIQSGSYATPLGDVSFTKVPNGGGEINQKQFYVAQIKMNADGNSGAFNLVP